MQTVQLRSTTLTLTLDILKLKDAVDYVSDYHSNVYGVIQNVSLLPTTQILLLSLSNLVSNFIRFHKMRCNVLHKFV